MQQQKQRNDDLEGSFWQRLLGKGTFFWFRQSNLDGDTKVSEALGIIKHREYQYADIYTEMQNLQIAWTHLWTAYINCLADEDYDRAAEFKVAMQATDDEAATLILEIEAED